MIYFVKLQIKKKFFCNFFISIDTVKLSIDACLSLKSLQLSFNEVFCKIANKKVRHFLPNLFISTDTAEWSEQILFASESTTTLTKWFFLWIVTALTFLL